MHKMNINQFEEIVNTLKKIIYNQNASEFNKRDCGMKQSTFMIIFTMIASSLKNVTLEGLALRSQGIQYGLRLTKQALLNRLGVGKKALQILLANVILETTRYKMDSPNVAKVLNQFRAVYITDATTISLPDKLTKYHKGLGGTNAISAIKIQATYEIKSKTFKKICNRENATENDNKYMKELLDEIEAGDLSITDLDYYSVGNFAAIDAKGAYFLSKIKMNTILYTLEDKPINMEKLLAKNLRKVTLGKSDLCYVEQIAAIDQMVQIKGEKGQTMKVRLCGIKVTEKVYAERIRKANQKAKATGGTLTQKEKEQLKWILIITNIPKRMLDYDAVCEIYRIRWQIELIFKSWKSYLSIDKMNNVGKDYWDCLLYGKLIVITMLTAMHARCCYMVFQSVQREVSFLRFMRNMCDNIDDLLEYMIHKKTDEQIIMSINSILRASLIEKRKRNTTEQSISEFGLPLDVMKFIFDVAA